MSRKKFAAIVLVGVIFIVLLKVDWKPLSGITKLVSKGGVLRPSGSWFGAFEEYIDFGVYTSLAATSEVEFIDWGLIEPGGSKNHDLYFRNRSNPTQIVDFIVTTANWNPNQTRNYMNVTLSYPAGFTSALAPNATIMGRLILHAFPNVTGITNFSFDVIITAYA